jgi:large subunit ribosomal protein L21
MYAIIRTGGKQSKVHEGDVIDVERLKDADGTVEFTPLLVVDGDGTAISDRAMLRDVKVRAKVLGEAQGPKVDIFKYKNKTGYRRRQGHRQKYTTLEVTAIELPGKKTAKAKAAEAPPSKKSADAAKAKAAEAPASKKSAETAKGDNGPSTKTEED